MKKITSIIIMILLAAAFMCACGEKKSSEKEFPKVIACIGDSITEGYGLANPDTESYPAILQEIAGDDTAVYNFGLSGRCVMTDGMAPYTSERYYTQSLELGADMYIIMLGSNDARDGYWNKENFKNELKTFTESYIETNPEARIVLMLPPSSFPNEYNPQPFGINPGIVSGELYDAVSEISSDLNTELVDIHDFTKNHMDNFPDGVHPDKEESRRIAEYIYDCIK
ncbi:MAG: GDSL-type esterase/lipase family protein [Clostridia bacterium]|nr:GDSL-type esterase/lipase family protein [Clostridia bacterium]